ncbi:ATPase [Candidatus Micrarchaeota archaeon]|nr:ATPase [Candidatus Micrarchaeota archaeon]
MTAGLIGLGAGLSVGAAALATAWAQSTIGSAGMGLMAEKDGTFTNVLILMAIPETMVILGFLVAFFLIGKIPGIG